MNREIRQREMQFRVWDNEKKCFVPQGEIVFSLYGDTRISVLPNAIEYIGDSCYNGEPQRGRFVVMQWTGLKDKQKVEGWEGDIREYKGKLYVLVCDGWRFRFERNMVNFLENEDITLTEDVMYESICLGNIFQDPDLLEPETKHQ